MHERPDLRDPLAAGIETIKAEVVHTIRHEMAVRLTDVLVRRTGIGSMGAPSAEAVTAAAEIAQAELGWGAARVAEETAAVNAFYALR